ncbi:putative hydroxypyruvate isomerase [uncultured Alphaproteobacteria bacterium]|jgi:hydroxypyruvate isomerase|uniref:Putative hydroxypyruvate isomerase n=1 Tax=uncultured Alphaproteobacteria bacterium TaxID=91750 RepID=A0A212JIT7_9PROT|nr:putative hydroxypyruvate isomerase [uncultured Alphaproteobacteria bacterium]
MPRFSAHLGFMFQEWRMETRFAVAREAGFTGVDLGFPYDIPLGRLGDLLAMNGLELACFHAPAGDWEAGERGLAALPGRRQEFLDGLEKAFDLAEFVEAKRIHVFAGLIPEDADFDDVYDTYVANLKRAAKEARLRNMKVLIEPICEQVFPDYMLATPDQALAVLADVDDAGLGLLYDVYHAQNAQGRIAETLEGAMTAIAHVHIAGVPDRAEPDTGEVNYPYVFDLLDAHGYPGWVGLEYRPRMGTLAGLRWAKSWGIKPDAVTIAPDAPAVPKRR